MSEARVVRHLIMASSIVLMAACCRGETTASPPELAEAPVFVEQGPVAPPQPAEAWFMFEDAVVRLDAEGYTTIPGTKGIDARDLFLAGDGRGYLVTPAGIRTIVGDDVEMVVEFNDVADRAAVGHDAYLGLWRGREWKNGDELLSRWQGGSWTTKPWADWTPAGDGAQDVGFDPTGTAWVLGNVDDGDDRLWHWGPSGWVAAELGEPSGESTDWCFFSLHASARALYATGHDYLMRIRGPNRVDRIDLVLPPFPSINDGSTTRLFSSISVNSDGDVALAETWDFVRFEGDAKVAKIVRLEGFDYFTGFGFDASDRLWVASGATIRVVLPDGEVIEIPSGSVPELLAGVRDLVVLDPPQLHHGEPALGPVPQEHPRLPGTDPLQRSLPALQDLGRDHRRDGKLLDRRPSARELRPRDRGRPGLDRAGHVRGA